MIFNFSNTVIGRDREGNDVMADGSIKLKTHVLSTEKLHDTEISKTPVVPKIPEQGGFDIMACVGSPEKLSSIDNNLQSDLSTDNILANPQISNMKDVFLKKSLVVSDDTLSIKDS